MPNWVHRTTKQYQTSVSPASLVEPKANYIQDPDMSAVTGQPNKYWTITGDAVTLKSKAERNAVDATIEAQRASDEKNLATSGTDTDRRLLGFMEVMVDEINILRQNAGIPPARSLEDYKTATKNNIGGQN